MRDWPRPQGPVRIMTSAGREVGIFPDYWTGIAMWSPGCTVTEISQEQYDQEMELHQADLARRGFVTRC